MTVSQALQQWLDEWRGSSVAPDQQICYVGFSGGMDSTVLLHALQQLQQEAERGFEVRPLHLDHALDPQSEQWRAQCQRFCEGLGLTLISERLPAEALSAEQPGLEAAARAVRYRFFERHLSHPTDALLLAHHNDDQAETVLLRLLQGRGMLPMPGKRLLPTGQLYRPLLPLPRAVVAQYAQEHGLNWSEDPSNQSLALDRNYLRHVVWPTLLRRWPGAGQQLLRVADSVGQNQAALAGLLADRQALPVPWCQGPGGVAVLRAWLGRNGEYEVTDRALGEFARQLAVPSERTPVLQLEAGRLLRRGDQVCYERRD
ncbi:MAG: tRNA lysidine(34) synthetase TilS [Pseudomonadales bacterium]